MSVRQSPDTSANLTWVKSSYSGSEGGNCIEVAWRKSSYSGSEGGECVEVAELPGTVHVRDSKDTTRPMLSFASGEWAAFIEHATRG